MGSFPYQNDPEKLLVLGVLRTACILFSHEPVNLAEGHHFLVIIFQSMAGLDPGKAQVHTNPKPRDEDDDYHLNEAFSMAKDRFRVPDNPSVWLPGLENPPSSHFPSSWSKNFDQSIPTLEFRSFLRLVIFLNMYHSHMETGNIASLHLQVEKVTKCMLAAFQPSAAGVIWNHMPTLFRGIYLLLSPFIGMVEGHTIRTLTAARSSLALFRNQEGSNTHRQARKDVKDCLSNQAQRIKENGQPYNIVGKVRGTNCISFAEALLDTIKEHDQGARRQEKV